MKAILAVVLSLGIAIPVPSYAATFNSPIKAPIVTAGNTAIIVKLQLNTPALSGQASTFKTAPAMTYNADALLTPVNAKAQLGTTPVYEQIQALKTAGFNLPDAVVTRQDAAEVAKIAATMPQGKLKDNMLMLAKMAELNSSGGTGTGNSLMAAYDNSVPQDTPLMAAPSGNSWIWGAVSKIPGLKAWAKGKAEAARGKTALRPVKNLTAEQVRFVPPPQYLPKGGTAEVPLVDKKIVGQEMAEQAFIFGAQMPGDNYNIFVSGPDGSGRETMVRQVLEEMGPILQNPGDIVAATNFEDEEKPVILNLKPGQGEAFKAGVSRFVAMMQRVLPQALTTGEFASAKAKMHKGYEAAAKKRQDDLSAQIAAIRLSENGFGISLVMESDPHADAEPGLALTWQGKMLTPEEKEAAITAGTFSQADYDGALAKLEQLYPEINAGVQELVNTNAEEHAAIHQKMEQVDAKAASMVAQQLGGQILGALSTSHEGDADHTALHERMEKRISDINADAAKAPLVEGYGFQFVQIETNQGTMFIPNPTLDGKIVDQAKIEEILASGTTLEQFKALIKKINTAAKPFSARVQEAMKTFVAEHKAIHDNAPKPPAEAVAYAQSVIAHAAANYPIFLGALKQTGEGPGGMKQISKQDEPSDFYRVSVLVNNAQTNGAPVVWEKNPTYENLFGYAESNARTMVLPGAGLMKAKGVGGPSLKAGSFLKARGGFLVLNVMDVLKEPGAWQALMAAVKTGQAEISEGGLMGLASMKGEKYFVPGKTKVVLIGAPMIKMLLQHHDEDFGRNFNVTSEFEPSLAISEQTIEGYLYFIKKIVAGSSGQIIDLSQDAISTVIEFSARLVDSNKKLTAQFGVLFGLLREASFWAQERFKVELATNQRKPEEARVITTKDVMNALSARDQRENVYQRHMRDLYNEDIFTVQTDNSVEGQINGLAVMGAFGVPMRITMVNSAGKFNIISNDQNAGTTGSSFNKSLENSKGFLTYAMGPKRTPKGEIRISFEQNYGGIDGDSATSTMLYGILSSLSGVPIKQNMAVTGSADMRGTVQAIGGVNEKVEGFFDLVAHRNQLNTENPPTVLVPATNVRDLQLRPDVAQAIREGKFRVIAINNIMQGIEQLTGVAYADIMEKVYARMATMK